MKKIHVKLFRLGDTNHQQKNETASERIRISHEDIKASQDRRHRQGCQAPRRRRAQAQNHGHGHHQGC